MKLKQYPKYKESNVEWIGKIPENWEIKRIKYICSQNVSYGLNESSEGYVDEGVRFLRITDIKNDNELTERGIYLTKNNINKRYLLNTGDVLIARSGSVGTSLYYDKKEHGECSFAGYLVRFAVNNLSNGKFLYYFTKSKSFYAQIRLYAIQTTIENFNGQKYANMQMAVPTLETQKQITNYLDKKTANLNSLLERDKQLIELLNERRIAMINHVVTKGLNPKAKFKDSGIDWIGKIPNEWEIRRINKLSNVSRGASPRPIDEPKYFDDKGEYAWVRIADLTSSDRYLLETTEKLSVLGKSLSVPLEPGRLFISIAGTVGKPIITKIKCCIHDGFVYFKNLKVNNEYLYYIFIGGQVYQGLGKLGTQLNLNTETIGSIPIPLPSKTEQTAIVQYLDKATSMIDKAVKKIEIRIELLEEYKKSLIHNVVTGKVDVRNT